MTKLNRILAALAVFAFVQGGSIAPAAAQIFMSPEQEKEEGAKAHPQIIKQFGGVYDSANLGGYVAQVGGRMAANSEDPGIGYTVTLLNSPVVNAFALPGGYVYTTRGLLALANSEAELAGVLGHEVGHVTAHHSAKRYDRAIGTAIFGAIVGAVTGSPIASDLASLGGQAYLAGFSRSQEYQADELGVKSLARAGYDPHAQSDFLATLGREEGLMSKISGVESSRMQIFATHPYTPDRVERAAEHARKLGYAPDTQPRNRDDYLSKIDGMLYADDPKEGFIRGQTFSHPELRLQFTVPEGFLLRNASDSVAAQAKDGSTIIFDGRKSSASPDRYLSTDFANEVKVRPRNIQTFTVSGMSAASGTGRAQTNSGNVDVTMVAIKYDSENMYRFLLISPTRQTRSVLPAMENAVRTFRKLTNAEAAALKPLHVRVVTATASDSVQSLSQRMAFSDQREERFRVLNGLDPGVAIVAGRRYKVIAE